MDQGEAQELLRENGREIGLDETRSPGEVARAFGLAANEDRGELATKEQTKKQRVSIKGSYFAS